MPGSQPLASNEGRLQICPEAGVPSLLPTSYVSRQRPGVPHRNPTSPPPEPPPQTSHCVVVVWPVRSGVKLVADSRAACRGIILCILPNHMRQEGRAGDLATLCSTVRGRC
jgi:hypothetical protein